MNETNWTNEYRTGRMRPRKSSKGIVSVLLMAVIFFGGVLSGLGLLNIQPFQPIQEPPREEEASLSFYRAGSQGTLSVNGADPDAHLAPELGMCFQELSLVSQKLYGLPRGLYITKVANDTDASLKGILPGDVLTAFAGQEVSSLGTLQRLLYAYQAGDTVQTQIYRNGQLYRIELILCSTDKH